MNYYNEMISKLIDNEIYCKAKDYSKERNRVNTYFEVGKLLYNAGKRWKSHTTGATIELESLFNITEYLDQFMF